MLTVILGASPKKDRFSYKAVKSLIRHGFEVVPVGRSIGEIAGFDIHLGHPALKGVHTVSIYLKPRNQTSDLQDYVLSLQPKRVIFNPGTNNTDFEEKLREVGIEVIKGCTLVMLSNGRYE